MLVHYLLIDGNFGKQCRNTFWLYTVESVRAVWKCAISNIVNQYQNHSLAPSLYPRFSKLNSSACPDLNTGKCRIPSVGMFITHGGSRKHSGVWIGVEYAYALHSSLVENAIRSYAKTYREETELGKSINTQCKSKLWWTRPSVNCHPPLWRRTGLTDCLIDQMKGRYREK